ncbi:Hpt domain-containing protein [Hydrogenophaga sp.]|uniref:hybrid sensor histidine kinase/response regulator n=1 Tax=Hydrogenophaga sp. TaxID=1904254 RepID=UPI00391DD538
MLDHVNDSHPQDKPVADIGPLAWVFDELRKSLDSANKAIRRFLRETEQSRDHDLEAVDPNALRLARQQLHQAVGALEMVGLVAPAQVLRAMEAAVQRFVQRPATCTDDAASRVERASFALIDYLEAVLNHKPVHPVALFAQYRDVQEVAAAERIHPADLWHFDDRGRDLPPPAGANALAPSGNLRAMFDKLVLLLVKTDSQAAAQQLSRLSAGVAAGDLPPRAVTFWCVASAFFEALATRRLVADVYTKRAVSRVLLQYNALSQPQQQVSEALLHDLLFFCAQASGEGTAAAPQLDAVRAAFGLQGRAPVDYHQATLGRFDPALLVQARKRIGAAKEAWSLFTSGDVARARQVVDHFALITESLLKLHPASTSLAQALVRAADQAVHDTSGVGPELAMEVATTTLFLEAAFEDFDPTDAVLTERTQALAERLEAVRGGAAAQPLEPWMEELYRRVSDRQTMGSVVGELKVSLADVEKSLDQFFRDPQEKLGLNAAVSQLAQMRGVLSVLGIEPAVQTVVRMRSVVEQIMETEVDEVKAREAGTFQHLGNNLSALSFLVDMLHYQPSLAKRLFVFDEDEGELKPLMGRNARAADPSPAQVEAQAITQGVSQVMDGVQGQADLAQLSQQLGHLADQASLADQPEVARAAREAAQAVAVDPQAGAQALVQLAQTTPPAPEPNAAPVDEDDDDSSLLDIFLEEAREVVTNGLEAVGQLRHAPSDLGNLTSLRRAFHTLKGSSRMVDLTEFGEAAWAMEQALNAALAEQRPAEAGLLDLSAEALTAFGQWADDVANQSAEGWLAQPFRASADAWRLRGDRLPLAIGQALAPQEASVSDVAVPDAEPVDDLVPTLESTPAPATPSDLMPDFDLAFDVEEAAVPVAAEERTQEPVAEEAPLGLDFDLDFGDASAPLVAPGEDPVPTPPRTLDELPQIEDIDFGSLASLSDEAPALEPMPAAVEPPAPLADEVVELDASAWPSDTVEEADSAEAVQTVEAEALPDLELPAEAQPEPVATHEEPPLDVAAQAPDEALTPAEPTSPAAFELPDEQTRVIGSLRIGLRLYNVYLNEADEWSRRLNTMLTEWALEVHEPIPSDAEALAHSLAGASATVGFQSLSTLARALEHALGTVGLHQQTGQAATKAQAKLFVDVSEDIRRLLHQFAAGFLKEVQPELLQALHDVVHAPAPAEPEWTPEEPEAQPEPAAAIEVPDAAAAQTDVALQVVHQQDIDDDIDAVDTIDVDLFPIFAEEAQELLPQLAGALRQWTARPENSSARAEVLRSLHTLKGSARLAGALRLGEMAHRMETDAERLGSDVRLSSDIEPLQQAFDAISTRFERLRRGDWQAAGAVPSAPEQVPEAAAVPPADTDVASPAGLTGLVVPAAPTVLAPRAGAAVRVRPELLDRLVNQAGEVIINRSRLEAEVATMRSSLRDLTGNLDRLRQQLRDIELQAETQMQSRLAQARDADQSFDPLEFDRFTRVQELTRMMAESVNDVATVQRNLQRTVEAAEDSLVAQARQTRELQRDLLRTRMVEFEGIAERLYRVVRQASKETGKQVRLDIVGGHIEMDRGILDRMTAAFEHLLRNGVVHGIESPEARLAQGKPAEGRIEIRLSQALNDVSVAFADDGAGLDLQRLREKGLTAGLIDDSVPVDDPRVAQLVFEAGISTAKEVSELAGRGIGMDVVRSEVVALGGRVETASTPGQGTEFTLVLPLTTAVTQVVMLRAGSLTVGVPSNLVELVRRVSADELAAAYASGHLRFGDEDLPFFWAGALLQSSPRSTEPQGRTLPVVIFRSASQRVALHVDEVLGNQEVVVKNLGPQLQRLPGLAGMSVLASGAVALIYNPVALASVYGPQVAGWVARQQTEGQAALADIGGAMPAVPVASVPLVLVVDDSITVRRVTQRLLQREGYRVALAADGLQALERLQAERPAVVLSDIEMPRMDGFDLVRNIRNDSRLQGLPVIMITSRIAEKHREHARELGVDHYLGKPYSEDELLGLVARYAHAEQPVA